MFKSFVIIVKGHDLGERFGAAALQTGVEQGWNLKRFDAVDGRKITYENLPEYGLKLDTSHKKQIQAMHRPGVFGNFLTHWKLWNLCVELNEPIGCFEHDIIFKKPPPVDILHFEDLLKLDRIKQQKPYGTGACWQGAHAHIIKPAGAKKLIEWGKIRGVQPADVMIGDAVCKIEFNLDRLIEFNPESHAPDGTALFSTSKAMTF
jgi:hypothetical protein